MAHHPVWQRKLSKTLTVSRVDEDIPTVKQKRNRKPWSIALTQKPGASPDVLGLPAGHTLVLSEHDVVALVRYLFEPQTAVWCENPEPDEPGSYEAQLFLQRGMIAIVGDKVVNGEAQWSPEYFKKQKPIAAPATPKIHTLPWKLPKRRRAC